MSDEDDWSYDSDSNEEFEPPSKRRKSPVSESSAKKRGRFSTANSSKYHVPWENLKPFYGFAKPELGARLEFRAYDDDIARVRVWRKKYTGEYEDSSSGEGGAADDDDDVKLPPEAVELLKQAQEAVVHPYGSKPYKKAFEVLPYLRGRAFQRIERYGLETSSLPTRLPVSPKRSDQKPKFGVNELISSDETLLTIRIPKLDGVDVGDSFSNIDFSSDMKTMTVNNAHVFKLESISEPSPYGTHVYLDEQGRIAGSTTETYTYSAS